MKTESSNLSRVLILFVTAHFLCR